MEYTNDITADTEAFAAERYAEQRNTLAAMEADRTVIEQCGELRDMSGKKADPSLVERAKVNQRSIAEQSQLVDAYAEQITKTDEDGSGFALARAGWLRSYVLQLETTHARHNLNVGVAEALKATDEAERQRVAMIEIELAHSLALAELRQLEATMPDTSSDDATQQESTEALS